MRNKGKWRYRVMAVLMAMVCLIPTAGCAASGHTGAGEQILQTEPSDAVTETIPATEDTVPTEETTTSTEAPQLGTEAVLLADLAGETAEPGEEVLFHIPEFPDVQFVKRGGTAYVLQRDELRYIMGGSEVWLSDLNGDGCREFCTVVSVGSGIVHEEIYVYDFSDDMYYTLQQRQEYDYDLTLKDGRLVALRYIHMGKYYKKNALCEGELVIKDRQLYFRSGDLQVQGEVSSPRFDADMLQQIMEYVQGYEDREQWAAIFHRPCNDYYFQRNEAAIRASIVETEEKRFWVDLGNVQDNRQQLRYLFFLELLTGTYVGFSRLEEYVYYDAAEPARLIVCTELRDRGYRDIQSYYEDLVTGNCQPHPDTYIVYLDRHAVCRWGEDTNLYTEAE